MYPNAYGANCNSGNTQPYGMPDFSSLQVDPLLPQRCQDPTVMQVSIRFFIKPPNSLCLSALHCRICVIGMRTCFTHLKVASPLHMAG